MLVWQIAMENCRKLWHMGDSCEALQIHCSGWQLCARMADSYGAWEIAVWQIAMEHGR